MPEVQITPTGSSNLWISPNAKKEALRSSTTEYNSKNGSDSIDKTIGICLLPGETTNLLILCAFNNDKSCNTFFFVENILLCFLVIL